MGANRNFGASPRPPLSLSLTSLAPALRSQPLNHTPLLVITIVLISLSAVCRGNAIEAEVGDFHVSSSLWSTSDHSSYPLVEFWAFSHAPSRLASARLPSVLRLRRFFEVEKGTDGSYVAVPSSTLPLRNASWTLHGATSSKSSETLTLSLDHSAVFSGSAMVARGASLSIQVSHSLFTAQFEVSRYSSPLSSSNNNNATPQRHVALEFALTGPQHDTPEAATLMFLSSNSVSESQTASSSAVTLRAKSSPAFLSASLSVEVTAAGAPSALSQPLTAVSRPDGGLWLVSSQHVPEKATVRFEFTAGLDDSWPSAAYVALTALAGALTALLATALFVWWRRRRAQAAQAQYRRVIMNSQ